MKPSDRGLKLLNSVAKHLFSFEIDFLVCLVTENWLTHRQNFRASELIYNHRSGKVTISEMRQVSSAVMLENKTPSQHRMHY
ncbi:hypothetical protein STEG23_010959, partial [Scotinomys teguina]